MDIFDTLFSKNNAILMPVTKEFNERVLLVALDK